MPSPKASYQQLRCFSTVRGGRKAEVAQAIDPKSQICGLRPSVQHAIHNSGNFSKWRELLETVSEYEKLRCGLYPASMHLQLLFLMKFNETGL